MDVALENAQKWAAEGATQDSAKSLRQKDRVGRIVLFAGAADL